MDLASNEYGMRAMSSVGILAIAIAASLLVCCSGDSHDSELVDHGDAEIAGLDVHSELERGRLDAPMLARALNLPSQELIAQISDIYFGLSPDDQRELIRSLRDAFVLTASHETLSRHAQLYEGVLHRLVQHGDLLHPESLDFLTVGITFGDDAHPMTLAAHRHHVRWHEHFTDDPEIIDRVTLEAIEQGHRHAQAFRERYGAEFRAWGTEAQLADGLAERWLRDGRTAEAIELRSRIIDRLSDYEPADPWVAFSLAANAQDLASIGEHDAAMKAIDRALLETSFYAESPEMSVQLEVSRIDLLGLPQDDSRTIDILESVWQTPSYIGTRDWFTVGSRLANAYNNAGVHHDRAREVLWELVDAIEEHGESLSEADRRIAMLDRTRLNALAALGAEAYQAGDHASAESIFRRILDTPQLDAHTRRDFEDLIRQLGFDR